MLVPSAPTRGPNLRKSRFFSTKLQIFSYFYLDTTHRLPCNIPLHRSYKTEQMINYSSKCRGITNVVSNSGLVDSSLKGIFMFKSLKHCKKTSSKLIWLKICQKVYGYVLKRLAKFQHNLSVGSFLYCLKVLA